MLRRIGLVAVSICVVLAHAGAAADTLGLSLNRVERAALSKPVFVPEAVGEKGKLSVTLGLAVDKQPSGGKVWSTPFLFDYVPANSAWDFQLSGDGITRIDVPGSRATGFSDVGVAALYMYRPEKLKVVLIGGAGLNLPAKGAVGSEKASQDLRLLAVFPTDGPWSGLGGLVLVHSDGTRPGVSQNTQVGLARATYAWSQRSQAKATLKRAYTRGAGGGSSLDLEYDFPIGAQDGALTLSRGLTSGRKNTKLQFDVTWGF